MMRDAAVSSAVDRSRNVPGRVSSSFVVPASSMHSRRLLRLADNQVPALRPRHAAFHHQKILFLVDAQHAQITLRYPRVAHMSRHAHSFEHARRKRRRANRSSDLEHRSVRLGTAAEVMPLHDALEALSLAYAHDV